MLVHQRVLIVQQGGEFFNVHAKMSWKFHWFPNHARLPSAWQNNIYIYSAACLRIDIQDLFWTVSQVAVDLGTTVRPRFRDSNWDGQTGDCWSFTAWWLSPTPLKNDGVRQLGWWHSIYGKIKNVPKHQPVYVRSSEPTKMTEFLLNHPFCLFFSLDPAQIEKENYSWHRLGGHIKGAYGFWSIFLVLKTRTFLEKYTCIHTLFICIECIDTVWTYYLYIYIIICLRNFCDFHFRLSQRVPSSILWPCC